MIPVKNLEEYVAENIIDLGEASDLILKLKKEGNRIGLCHGGFDLLHPGQVKHLGSAKKMCDFLFVSVTSDQFVSGRKGSGRPIFNEKLRAYMVANLKFIDYVIISDYKSGIEVINQLRPSFYIKGPDFINKNTPGINAERKAIEDVGGEIGYTHDSKLSTTEIINYIKNDIDLKKILLCIDRDGTLIEEQNFLGRENNWIEKIKLKESTISLISFLQTKYSVRKIILSNQAGVARGYFDCKRVEEINDYLKNVLKERGIIIDDWQYCPDVDLKYAEANKDKIYFNPKFIKETTKRKPNEEMILDGLKNLNKKMEDFTHIIVLGDREEDKGLAKKINALYIDAEEKYEDMIKKVEF